jgi:hypothetical protein
MRAETTARKRKILLPACALTPERTKTIGLAVRSVSQAMSAGLKRAERRVGAVVVLTGPRIAPVGGDKRTVRGVAYKGK